MMDGGDRHRIIYGCHGDHRERERKRVEGNGLIVSDTDEVVEGSRKTRDEVVTTDSSYQIRMR